MEHYLIFDDINLNDYGVLISGEGVFNAPARDVQVVEVPGRNGDVIIDNGRFENISVAYPCTIKEGSLRTFADVVGDLRAALSSKRGYMRLTDTFHPDEYRMACFRGGLEVDPIKYNKTAGEFTLTFDCKPQRFLVSGENQVDVSTASRQTLTGNPVSFYWTSAGVVHDMIIHANEMTAGTNPSPNNPALMVPWEEVLVSVNGGSYQTITLPEEMAAVDIDMTAGRYSVSRGMHIFDGTETLERVVIGASGYAQNIYGYRYTWNTGAFAADFCTRFEMAAGSGTQADLTARFSRNGSYCILIFRFDAVESVEDMQTMLADWSEAGNPMIITGDYITPVTGSLTVPTLTYTDDAVNTVYVGEFWAGSVAEIEMDVTAVAALTNPTPFKAYPLVEITGTGTVKIGETTLTISANANPPICIDCELMEAYQVVNGVVTSANSLVTMDNHIFPSLPTGASAVQASSGITGLVVTPRWWRV